MKFTVTKSWIMEHRTPKGAWTAKQMGCLNLDWPAKKGWIKRANGMVIEDAKRARFEELASELPKPKVCVKDHERRLKELEGTLAALMEFFDKTPASKMLISLLDELKNS